MNKQISRKDLNDHCLNCGTHLKSKFCPECGQKHKDYSLTFKDFLADFLEELLDVDSRVLRSLRLLFTKPGFLTSEYVKGRRISYIPPVRIYLVASVLFFLVLSIDALIPSFKNNQFLKEFTETGDIDDALDNVVQSRELESEKISAPPDSLGSVVALADTSSSEMSVTIGQSKYDMEQNDFRANFSENFAKMMFLLLPVAALQLKALYWRRKKSYIEHLIFSLHVHAFIFSILILTILIDFKVLMWLVILASLFYLYLAMKSFYLQSYLKTLSKMMLLLLSYGLTLGSVMTLTMVITAISQVLSGS